MKKFTTWIFCLVFLTGVLPALGNAFPDSKALSFQELSQTLRSPEEIAHYMWRHFRYESDRTRFGVEDRWQSPEELLASQQGDCEDFALFAREILKSQGVKAFIVNVYGRGFGHSVCVFQKGGRYHVIDGSSSQAYDATDLKEIFAWVYPFWNKAAIVGFSESARCGTLLKLFQRKS